MNLSCTIESGMIKIDTITQTQLCYKLFLYLIVIRMKSKTVMRAILNIEFASDLQDLRVPPANRLEKLKGNLKEFHSIRINDQWRVIFSWDRDTAYKVRIVDYH